MKKAKFILTFLAMLTLLIGLCACGETPKTDSVYQVSLNAGMSTQLTVGDTVDYAEYFTITDQDGKPVPVTAEMLDLSKADTTKPGTFTVTLTVGKTVLSLPFTVVAKQEEPEEPDEPQEPEEPEEPDEPQEPEEPDEPQEPEEPDEPQEPEEPADPDVFSAYADRSAWNFAVTVTVTGNGDSYEDYYEYDGSRILNTYLDDYNEEYTDYLTYDAAADAYTYYYDNGDGTYTVYDEDSDEFYEYYSYSYLIDLTCLGDFDYTVSGNVYTAASPNDVGNAVGGEYEDITWTSFTVTVTDGKITKMVGKTSDGYTTEYAFSDYGKIKITIPAAEGGDGGDPDVDPTPSQTMEKQTYDPSTFDRDTLQDKLLKEDGAIGLPSTGNYHALVIPVQFQGDTITQEQLNNLNIAFNGTEEQTGWESVKTYYQKASYGKLNLTFDVQEIYHAKNKASYYEQYMSTDDEGYPIMGDAIVLNEALAFYEKSLDYTKYDTNKDGTIDAVYLIYSAPVDYGGDFFWAFVTWYYGTNTYDGLDAYYYLFAGFDFMEEKTPSGNPDYDVLPGMKINAETYIHESGHLLGLEDYYDYVEEDTEDDYGNTIPAGSNEGLGGADMMDSNIGDQGVYTKIMLGWLTPTVVTETTTVTLSASATTGSAILIPLDFDNTYFCEYLLIDLYSATGLNAMHASDLYDGAKYGVRIYHVASWIKDPYNNAYSSFTDNNNSTSENALVKLVEADGTKKFSDSDGFAAADDLWKAGQTFSAKFPSYTRYDGKKINFDIQIGKVSATSATVTVTF